MIELTDVTVTEMELDGVVAPVINLNAAGRMDVALRFQGREYAFAGSVLLKGYGAVLPDRVRQALEEGRRPLLAQRGDRYYLYLTRGQTASPPSKEAS